MKENGVRADLLDGDVRNGLVLRRTFFLDMIVVRKRRDCWRKW